MRKNVTLTQRLIFIFVFILFFVYSASILYPIFWGLTSSFKNGAIEYFNNSFGFPKVWIFENYSNAFEMLSYNGISFYDMTFNSFWLSFCATFIGIYLLSHFAYVLARFKFPGNELIIYVSIIMMVIPLYGTLPAAYKYYNMLGITDSPLYLVIYTGIMGGNQLLITKSFYANLPEALSEAAKIDGANDWQIYFKIMMPLATGVLLSFFLTNFIANWNDYMTPILYLPSYPTLAAGLFTYQTIVERSGDFPLYFAGCAIAMIPIIVLYSLLSNKLVNNLSYGGLKG